ncbi:hypothetical protein [Leptospira interrogans]|uniref:hypothetical protein n=1 Tax=Leptospira interrogans TaxID=173 RepID=UPI000773B2E5|nr:hypothetical protein [Leptospira interrogans]
MQFNTDTLYLENPPPVEHVGFDEFKNQYQAFSKKANVLFLLSDYCRILRKNNIIPMYLILGGNYLKNEDSPNSILKIIACFRSDTKVDSKAVTNHLSNIGETAKRYRGVMEPIGRITLNNNQPDDLRNLNYFDNIQALQKDHTMENRLSKVGLIRLSFNEVV